MPKQLKDTATNNLSMPEMDETITRLQNDGFVLFSFDSITTEVNKRGEEKKKPNGMPLWKSITKDNSKNYFNKNHKAFGIVTGEISGLTVLDFDDASQYDKMCEQYPILKSVRTIKTRKGYHLYFKYNKALPTTTDYFNDFKGIDIRNDSGVIFAPPTTYSLQNGETCGYYDCGGEFIDVPDFILNMKPKQEEKKAATKKDALNFTSASEKEKLEAIRKLANEGKLEKYTHGSWDDWRNIGFIVHNTSKTVEGLKLFHEISKLNTEKYDEHTTNEFWYTIKEKTKNPLTIASLFEPEVIFCNDDNEASDYMYEKLKSTLKSYKRRLFFKRENVWICDKSLIEDAVLNEVLNSNIHKKDNKGNPIKYAQSVGNARNIMHALLLKIRLDNNDANLYEKFHSTTKGKLCFEDGVLNIVEKSFKLYENMEENEIYTTYKIPRKFGEYFKNPNKEVIKTLKTSIFEPLYGYKMDEALHFLSRAIAGHHEDKRWATYVGNRNCGKGVEFDLLVNSFGDYVKTFNLDNVLCTRQTEGYDLGEAGKKNYWLLDHEFTRLAVSQETPEGSSEQKINSKQFKKLNGGGDEIVARRNYDREDTYFTIDTTFYAKGNNSLKATSDDVFETRIEFASLVQFKSEAEIEAMRKEGRSETEMLRYRVADPTIKKKCNQEEWRNACVMLLLENYKTTAVPVYSEELDIEDNSLLKAISQQFDITGNDKDMILASDMKNYLSKYDSKKIVLEFSSMNVHKKKCNSGDYKNKWCFYGIKLKHSESDE